MMTLFGWTWDQWARAFAVIGFDGEDLHTALEVKREWTRRYSFPPGDFELEGVDFDMDHNAACALFNIPEGLR